MGHWPYKEKKTKSIFEKKLGRGSATGVSPVSITPSTQVTSKFFYKSTIFGEGGGGGLLHWPYLKKKTPKSIFEKKLGRDSPTGVSPVSITPSTQVTSQFFNRSTSFGGEGGGRGCLGLCLWGGVMGWEYHSI